MKANMKIYVVRHGETEFNLHKMLMGQHFDIDLNKKGVQQAEELAEIIPAEVDIIFSSPLRRAFHTAVIIGNAKNLSVISRDELEERDYGSLSGKTWDEIEKTVGLSLEHIEEQLDVDLSKFNSETIGILKARLMHFLADLKKHYSDKKPLIVTHSGIIRLLYNIFPNTQKLDVKNASLHTFEI